MSTDEPSGPDLARSALAAARQAAAAREAERRSAEGRDASISASRRRRAGRGARAVDPSRGGDPVSFGAAIEALLGARGWQSEVTVATVTARWGSVVGEEMAARCRPVSLRDGELVLEAESTAWATQVRLMSGTLLGTIREQLGADVVTKIVVRGPTAPVRDVGRLRSPDSRGPRDTYG